MKRRMTFLMGMFTILMVLFTTVSQATPADPQWPPGTTVSISNDVFDVDFNVVHQEVQTVIDQENVSQSNYDDSFEAVVHEFRLPPYREYTAHLDNYKLNWRNNIPICDYKPARIQPKKKCINQLE